MNKKLKTNLMAISIITILVTSIFLCGYAIGKNKAIDEVWHNNRSVKAVTVHYGDTLWSIAKEYKPNNVYILEYIEDIKQLNKITNSTIHGGDTILVYVYGHNTKDDIILEVHNND